MLHTLAVATGMPVHFEYTMRESERFPRRLVVAVDDASEAAAVSAFVNQLPEYSWTPVTDGGRDAVIIHPIAAGTALERPLETGTMHAATVRGLLAAMASGDQVQLMSETWNPIAPSLARYQSGDQPWLGVAADLSDLGRVPGRVALATLLLRISEVPLTYQAYHVPAGPARYVDVRTAHGVIGVPVEPPAFSVLIDIAPDELISLGPRSVPPVASALPSREPVVRYTAYASSEELLGTEIRGPLEGRIDDVAAELMSRLGIGVCLEAPRAAGSMWSSLLRLPFEEQAFRSVLDQMAEELGPAYRWRVYGRGGRYLVALCPVDGEESRLGVVTQIGTGERVTISGLFRALPAGSGIFLEGRTQTGRPYRPFEEVPGIASKEVDVLTRGSMPFRDLLCDVLMSVSDEGRILYYDAYWAIDYAAAERFVAMLRSRGERGPVDDVDGVFNVVNQWVVVQEARSRAR
jgi:hypothetical protein